MSARSECQYTKRECELVSRKKGCVGNGDASVRVGLGLDPTCEWTLNPGPALRCIVGRHRNVLLQLLLTVLLTITVCVLASSGHSSPGSYNLMKLNVRRSVFSVPSLNLVSITSSPIIREAAAGWRGGREEKRNAAKTPEAAAEARALRWRATLRSGRGDGNWFTICPKENTVSVTKLWFL